MPKITDADREAAKRIVETWNGLTIHDDTPLDSIVAAAIAQARAEGAEKAVALLHEIERRLTVEVTDADRKAAEIALKIFPSCDCDHMPCVHHAQWLVAAIAQTRCQEGEDRARMDWLQHWIGDIESYRAHPPFKRDALRHADLRQWIDKMREETRLHDERAAIDATRKEEDA